MKKTAPITWTNTAFWMKKEKNLQACTLSHHNFLTFELIFQKRSFTKRGNASVLLNPIAFFFKDVLMLRRSSSDRGHPGPVLLFESCFWTNVEVLSTAQTKLQTSFFTVNILWYKSNTKTEVVQRTTWDENMRHFLIALHLVVLLYLRWTTSFWWLSPGPIITLSGPSTPTGRK